MAILDRSKKKFIIDRNDDIYTGIDLPFRRGAQTGYFESTRTTIDAIKNDIRNLLLTDVNERVMQPSFGLNLKQFLFQQLNSETVMQMKESIVSTIEKWLPMVIIKGLVVEIDENTHTLMVKLTFAITSDSSNNSTLELGVGELEYGS